MIEIETLWPCELRRGNSDHPRNGSCLMDAGKGYVVEPTFNLLDTGFFRPLVPRSLKPPGIRQLAKWITPAPGGCLFGVNV